MALLGVGGISKYWVETRTLANDGVSLSLEAGEIRAIVGENGAGKSTLARVIAGLVIPDSGSLSVRGKPLGFGSVRGAERAGIGLVPQYSFLAAELSVAENLVLGQEPRRLGVFLDRRRAAAAAAALAEEFGFRVDPQARAGELGPAERRQAEILRALSRGGDVIILDEPATHLSEAETAQLYALLRRLAQAGKGILLITHRVPELRALASTVTVLRDGRVVADRPVAGLSDDELSALMAGGSREAPAGEAGSALPEAPKAGDKVHAARFRGAARRRDSAAEADGAGSGGSMSPILAEGLVLDAAGRGPRLDFEVRAGEVLGIAALAGNGLDRLEDLAVGLEPAAAGSILVEGRPVRDWNRAWLRAELLGYVPGNREARALAQGSSIADNLLALDRRRLPRAVWRHPRLRRAPALELARRGALSADPGARASSLSGGNRQRLVLARELDPRRKVFLLREPTQGLDRSSAAFQAGRIRALATGGAAVLVLSADLDELFLLADRIGILYKGGLVHLGPNRGESERRLLVARLTGLGPIEAGVRAEADS